MSESLPRVPGADGAPAEEHPGGDISSAPTVDMKQHLVYVTTRNGDSGPAQPPTDVVFALDVYTGAVKSRQQVKPAPSLKSCGIASGCSAAGRGGALNAIPGAVLNGAIDGSLRAYSTKDGSTLWTFDTNRDFDTVNGVKAHGGSMESAGPVVVDGMLYVSSGAGGSLGRPGKCVVGVRTAGTPAPEGAQQLSVEPGIVVAGRAEALNLGARSRRCLTRSAQLGAPGRPRLVLASEISSQRTGAEREMCCRPDVQ